MVWTAKAIWLIAWVIACLACFAIGYFEGKRVAKEERRELGLQVFQSGTAAEGTQAENEGVRGRE